MSIAVEEHARLDERRRSSPGRLGVWGRGLGADADADARRGLAASMLGEFSIPMEARGLSFATTPWAAARARASAFLPPLPISGTEYELLARAAIEPDTELYELCELLPQLLPHAAIEGRPSTACGPKVTSGPAAQPPPQPSLRTSAREVRYLRLRQ